MLLHRLHLDARCREVRRDLSDPYQMHRTLCRAFSPPDVKCPAGGFLWRLEPELGRGGVPRLLVQSNTPALWDRIGVKGWLFRADPAIDLRERLALEGLKEGMSFRFRLRANPCVCRGGKRMGLLKREDQEQWIEAKGLTHGFALGGPYSPGADVSITQERMLRGNRGNGSAMSIYSVLYDGRLTVTKPELFREALARGIGHAKGMGQGLLSVAPLGDM